MGTMGCTATALLVALLAFAAPAAAGSSDDAGKLLYMHYCSSCHGEDGRGNGDLAAILRIEPADLTQLRKTGGKEFSYLTLLQSIDGRKAVRGHGPSDMPVWGEVLSAGDEAPVGEQLQSAGKLLLIANYVESLQQKQ